MKVFFIWRHTLNIRYVIFYKQKYHIPKLIYNALKKRMTNSKALKKMALNWTMANKLSLIWINAYVCLTSGDEVDGSVRVCVCVAPTDEEKAWEWITANGALRKALKRGVSPTTLSKFLMFSHECLLTSCFLFRSCHQGGAFFSSQASFQLQQLADLNAEPTFKEFVSLLNIHLTGFVQ